MDGLVNVVRPHVRDGSVSMLQKHVVTLASIIVVSVITSYGIVVQSWADWSTTTLVDLDKRTAIMEVEAKHTNMMVTQNHDMLKALMEASRKTSYGNRKNPTGKTDIQWTEE